MPITPWDEIKAQVGYDELPTEGKVDTINKYSQYVQEYFTKVEPRDAREIGEASDEFVRVASQDALGNLGVLERGSAFLGNIYRGAAGTFTSAFRAAALAQQAIGESLGNYDDSTPITERDLYRIAQNVDDSVKQTTGIEDPRLRNDFINTLLPQGLGSALGFFGVAAAAAAAAPEAAAVGVGIGTAAALGAATNAGQIYEEAKQSGANEFVSRASAVAGGVVGLSEAIPLGGLAGKLTAGLAKRSIIRGIAEGASEEFLQETGSQMANNLIASKFAGYDPDRGVMDGALQSGAVGLVTGGLIGGGVSAITRDNEAFYADRVSDEIRRKADLASSLTPERMSQITDAARNASTRTTQRINIETGETESDVSAGTVFGNRVGGEVPDIGENPATNSVLLGRSVSQDADGRNTETYTFHTPQGLLWEAQFRTGEPVSVRDVTDDSPLLNPITSPANPRTATRSQFTGRIISPTSSLSKEFGLETEQEMDQRLISEAQRAMQLGKAPDQSLLPDNQIIVDSVSRDDRGVARQAVLRGEIDRLYKIREAMLAKQILVGENPNAGTTEYDPNTAKEVIRYDSEGNKIADRQETSQRVARINRMIGMRETELRGLIARPESYIMASERNTPPSASQKLALVQGFQNLWNTISSAPLRDAIAFEVGDINPLIESGQVPKGAVAYYRRAIDGRKAMIFLSDRLATVPMARREMLHELGHAFWDTLPAGVQAEIRGLWKAETESRTGALFDEFGGLKGEVSPRVMDSVQEFFSERLAWTNDNWAKGLSESNGVMNRAGRAFRALLDRFLRYTGHGERLNLEFRSFLDQGDRFKGLRARIDQAVQAGRAGINEEPQASIRGMVKYEKLFEFVKNNPNGFTVDPVSFRIPDRGYVVAPSKATEDFIPSNLSREDAIKAFRSYMLSQENIFKAFGEGRRMVGVAGEGAYFGGWRTDTDANNKKLPEGQYRYVTDISFVLDNKEDALYLAENGQQQSIFDIAAGQTIDTEPALSELRASGILPPSGRGRLQELGGKVNQLAGREGSLRAAIQSLGRTFNPINQVGRVQAQAGSVQEAGSAEVAASVRGAQSQNLSSGERNDLAFWVSQRTPKAVKATENPLEQDLVIGLNEILRDKSLAKKQSKLVRDYVGFKTKFKNDEQVLRDFVEHLKGNLLWLHDSYSPELRERARLWYQGGRKIVDSWSIGNSLSTPQVAGTLAVLSPQKDWFMNLSLAERVLRIHTTKQDEIFSPDMVRWFESDSKRSKEMVFVSKIAGKKYSELSSPYYKALFIRAYDEVNNTRSYSVYSPEGDPMGAKRNLDGSEGRVAWGSFPQIEKAVSIIENPTRSNISAKLGGEHKVRNFYNNLLLPNLADYGDVTVDTHAVAAGLLRPLAGGDTEVLHNLGGGASSSVIGSSGLYGLYADAYRMAAAERGVLPREMQSITWEAVRGLFKPTFKAQEKNKALIDGIWREYERGKTDETTTRQRILEAAGGIESPEWSRGRTDAVNAGRGDTPNPQELSGSGMARQDSGGRDGRRVRESVTRDIPQEVRASTRGETIVISDGQKPLAKAALNSLAEIGWETEGAYNIRNFGNGSVIAQLRAWPDGLLLNYISTPDEFKGMGLASKALKEITKAADKYGVTIRGIVDPKVSNQTGLSKKQLFAWYKRNGFERDRYMNPNSDGKYGLSDYITRKPRKAVSASTIESQSQDLIGAPISFSTRGESDARVVSDRSQRIQDAATAFIQGEISREEFNRIAVNAKPIGLVSEVQNVADKEAIAALDQGKQDKYGAARDLPSGTPVGLRIDIPAFKRSGVYVVTIHNQAEKGRVGKVIGYDKIAAVKNAKFFVANQKVALSIAQGYSKTPLATVEGNHIPISQPPADIISGYQQVGYDPERFSYFYSKTNGNPIVSADEAILAGNTVFVKGAVEGNRSDFLYSTRGEQVRQIAEPIISFARNSVRTGGSLPYDIFRIAEQRGFNANEKMLRAKNAIDDLDAASKRVYGRGLDKLTADESVKINEALQNPLARARLSPDLAAAVGNARNLLDSLSAELIRSGAIPDRLVPVVTANMGVYLTRAYEKWENPKFDNPFSRLPKEVQNKIESTVKGWMESRYANAYAKEQSLARGERAIDSDSAQYQSDYQTGISKARNGGITKTEIRGYIDMLGAPEGESPFSQLGSGLTKDLSIITARKDIPPEIRQLWGEIKDPRVNFMLSMQRMTNLLETHNMLKAVRDAGMNKIFFNTPREGFSAKLVSQGSRTTSPLNMFIEGMSNDVYTSEEIAKAMQDTFGGRSKAQDALGKIAEWYLKANGISKFAKTVLSVQTQVRNLLGNAQFLIANGYIFSPDGAIAMQKLREIVLPAAGQQLGLSRDKALRDYSAKLTRLGILGQGVFANEMQSYFKDANINMATDFFDNYLMKSIKRVGGVATGLYQMGDSIPKAVAFEVELARLRRAYPTQPLSKLETMAADKVLNLLPTYSRISKLGNILRAQPFVGAFISFPLEVVRTGYNLIGTINEELRSDNAEIRKTGAYRLAGTMLATVGFSAAAAGLAAAMGIDDEEDKAIRQLDAPWDKYSTKLYLGRDNKGNVQQVNLSYVDPYNYLRDPLIALVKADGTWDQRLFEAVKTAFEPFYGEQILAGKILDITRNKKGTTGGRVFNPEAGIYDRSTAIAGHLFDAFNIGTVASGIRVYKGLTGQVTQTGRAYDPALETLATVTGQRVVTLDPRQSISFAARKFNNRINDATGIFTAAYYDRSNLTQEAKLKAYQDMMDSRSEIFGSTSSVIRAAMLLGVSRSEIIQILRQQGVSRQSAVALLNGTVSPYNSSRPDLRADATRYRQQALSATR